MPQQGLFGRKAPAEQQDDRFLEALRRSRMLEERYSTLERRAQLIEENLMESNKKFSAEIRLINDDIAEVKKSAADINEKIQLLAAELQNFARKEDVDVIRKYLQYWEPLNFVTQKQVENLIKDILEEKEKKE